MEIQNVDLDATFLLILGHQLVNQIGIAHAVQIAYALTDETVGSRAINSKQPDIATLITSDQHQINNHSHFTTGLRETFSTPHVVSPFADMPVDNSSINSS